MNPETIEKALALFARIGYAILATADARGVPHVSTARKVAFKPDHTLHVSEWFCPGTLENVGSNGKIAVVIWDRGADRGYQLLGEVERIDDLAVLDGYHPASEREPVPQVQRRLVVRVDQTLAFSHAPHTDREERVEPVGGG